MLQAIAQARIFFSIIGVLPDSLSINLKQAYNTYPTGEYQSWFFP